MHTVTRDRAFERIVTISKNDNERFMFIIKDIPRDDVVKHERRKDGFIHYIVKVKKQELLMIKLSIETKAVERVKRKSPRRPMSNWDFI